MSTPRVSQVPIYAMNAEAAGQRRDRCRISADVAVDLGIPLDRMVNGRACQVRIGVTDADVNLLFSPAYVDYVGKSASLVVEGMASGSHRVEIYANSGPGAKDGGVFRLFGGGNPFAGSSVPTNAGVTLCREELVQACAV